MLKNSKCTAMIFTMMLILWGVFFVFPAISQEMKTPPLTLMASDVLPRSLLVGANYSVNGAVSSDGLINTYQLKTSYGPLTVESTALLLKRIAELRAISTMEQLKGTELFLNAAKGTAVGPVKTAAGLVTDPVGTTKGIVSGIGGLFSAIGQAVTDDSPYKPSATSAALGQASAKRQFAYEFGIDPYSSYQPLQKILDEVAWAAAAGSLTVKAAFSAIPGGAGAAISLSGTADTLRSVVRENPPGKLKEINAQSLRQMGVSDSLTRAFLNNNVYDPYEQTLLVGELAHMKRARNRAAFISVALSANEESVAMFMRVMAQLVGIYNERIKPVESFVEIEGLSFFKTVDGKIIGVFPLDAVFWTARLETKGAAISNAIKKMKGIRGMELWVGGTIDSNARAALEKRGWKVVDRFSEKLFHELMSKN